MTRTAMLAGISGAVIAAGCGSDDKNYGGGSPPPPPAPSVKGGSTITLGADPGGALRFTKTKLTAKAGTVTLVLKNPSSSGTQHGIAVEGKGVDKDGPTAAPGGTSKVTVDLKPGTYEFYCPVDGHKQAGMEGKLTVE
jgi:uncharacterized cupredoxin-like copper-binding protein